MAQIIAKMKDESPIKLPENIVVRTGMKSSVLMINLTHIKRANLNMFELATDSMADVVTKRDSFINRENRYTLEGLITGMRYQVRVGAGPANGMVHYGETVETVCE
jgi:hypothetical protein